jgi:hypothetical protein
MEDMTTLETMEAQHEAHAEAFYKFALAFPDHVLQSLCGKYQQQAFVAGMTHDTDRFAALNAALWIVTKALTKVRLAPQEVCQ